MKNKFFLIYITIVSGLFFQCAPFRDSPYSDQILRHERELNLHALERLGDIESDSGVIRFAVFSDSHQNYKELDKIIVQINKTENLDFVVNLGDFTNSGYNLEYDQFLDSYVLLRNPAFSVIGNHDSIGAGVELFKRVFGPSNFYFESTSKRFIFFQSSNLEDMENFSPQWLIETVESSTKPVIIFTHAHLQDKERYTGEVEQIFKRVIQHSNTQLIMNGHNHVYEFRKDSGTLLLQCGRAEGAQWLLIEIQNTHIQITRMELGEVILDSLKN